MPEFVSRVSADFVNLGAMATPLTGPHWLVALPLLVRGSKVLCICPRTSWSMQSDFSSTMKHMVFGSAL